MVARGAYSGALLGAAGAALFGWFARRLTAIRLTLVDDRADIRNLFAHLRLGRNEIDEFAVGRGRFGAVDSKIVIARVGGRRIPIHAFARPSLGYPVDSAAKVDELNRWLRCASPSNFPREIPGSGPSAPGT
jgi:hypothetical protein